MSANSRTLLLVGLIGVILIGAALIVLPLINQPAAAPIPPTSLPTVPPQRLDEAPAPEVPRVSIGEAYAAHSAKQAVFVDVRSASQYEASHVAGAVSIPLGDLESRLNELDKEQWIITYCT
jgi:hypothetical protein